MSCISLDAPKVIFLRIDDSKEMNLCKNHTIKSGVVPYLCHPCRSHSDAQSIHDDVEEKESIYTIHIIEYILRAYMCTCTYLQQQVQYITQYIIVLHCIVHAIIFHAITIISILLAVLQPSWFPLLPTFSSLSPPPKLQMMNSTLKLILLSRRKIRALALVDTSLENLLL